MAEGHPRCGARDGLWAAVAAAFGDGVKMGRLPRDPLPLEFQPTRSTADQDRGAAFVLSGDIP